MSDTSDQFKQFINTLFHEDDVVEVRPIPVGGGTPLPYWFRPNEADPDNDLTGEFFDDLWAKLQTFNQSHNIYLGANPRSSMGAKGDKSVALARSLFVDIDYHKDAKVTTPEDYEVIRHRVADAKLPDPSIVINSGHGFWLIWLMEQPLTDMDLWTRHQRSLATALEGDIVCSNPERIIRMPGTVNHKPPVVTSTLMTCTSVKHPLNVFPAPEEKKVTSPTAATIPYHPKTKFSADIKSDDADVLYAMFFQKYGEGMLGLQNALQDAGLEVLSDNGDGCYIRSPNVGLYTTPVADTDLIIYKNFSYSPMHAHDQNLYDTSPNATWGFAERFLPAFWCEFQSELAKNKKPKSKAWECSSLKKSDDPALELLEQHNEAAQLIGEAITDVNDLEVHDESIQQEVYKVSLNDFPDAIQELTRALCNINRFLSPILHLGCAYSIAGALIGKRTHCINAGSKLYPNLWSVMLAKSGSAKTGTLATIKGAFLQHQIGALLPDATMAAMQQDLGKLFTPKVWQAKDIGEQAKEKQEYRIKCENVLWSRILLSDECTGVLDSLLGGWNAKNPTKDIAALLEISDGGPINRHTTTGGYKMAYDLCVNFLGFSQNTTWNAKYGSDTFLECGFFGRFIPWTDKYIELVDIKTDKPVRDFNVIFEEMAKAMQVNRRHECYFGPPTPEGEQDFIGVTMDEVIQSLPEFSRIYEKQIGTLRNKFIAPSIRMSMVDAFLNGDIKNVFPVQATDCQQYFKKNAHLVTKLFFVYFQQIETESEHGKKKAEVLQELRRNRQGCSEDYLKERVSFYKVADLREMLIGLLQSGEVVKVPKKNKRGKPTQVYKLVA